MVLLLSSRTTQQTVRTSMSTTMSWLSQERNGIAVVSSLRPPSRSRKTPQILQDAVCVRSASWDGCSPLRKRFSEKISLRRSARCA